ncbi:MAG: hypothetical protein HQK83_14375 [Fibrobacteria bacterium]|nr:hypothetical protein [Fibrobacteria bacterium]
MNRKLMGSLSILFIMGLCLPVNSIAAFNFFDPAAGAPAVLSTTGLYTGTTIISEAVPYAVNVPHWQDAQKALNYVVLKAGATIVYDDTTDHYTYSDGVVFVQTIYVDTVTGDISSRVLYETRLLVNKIADVETWNGFCYRWRMDQTDADLVADLDYVDTTLSYRTGNTVHTQKWEFAGPLIYCDYCHQGRGVQGFFTAQLNMPSPANPAINQITDLFNKGVFSGTPPANLALSPKWINVDQPGDLDVKARSYLASNCSGCHGTKGTIDGPDINLDFHAMHKVDTPPLEEAATTFGAIPNCADTFSILMPGLPNQSTIVYRQTVRSGPGFSEDDYYANPDQMPQANSYKVDVAAVTMLQEWICQMNPTACAAQPCAAPSPIKEYYPETSSFSQSEINIGIKGKILTLESSLTNSKNLDISMTSLNGQAYKLENLGKGIYRIDSKAPTGLYIFKVNGQATFKVIF